MVIRKYKHCGIEFERDVRYIPGNVNPSTRKPSKRNAMSTPVRCPICLNLIKTWQ